MASLEQQEQMLRELAEAAQAAANSVINLESIISSNKVSGSVRKQIIEQLRQETVEAQKLTSQYNLLNDAVARAKASPGGRVPGGATPGPTPATPPTSPRSQYPAGILTEPDNLTDKKKGRDNAAAKALEAERQMYMKREAFAKEAAAMAELGFKDAKSQFKYSRGVPGGAYNISRWEKVEDGRRVRQDARVDPQGNVSTGVIPQQNRSFTQGIGKDIGDLLKWSIAISAIYGPINALSEAMSQLIENESKLADVAISLNANVADTSRVFDDVNKAARASGESISGVIDAFGAAYTAAGRISDPLDRYNSTLKLLSDSLTLSKLSTLDQAGAIDVLTAALYQTAKANEPANTSLARGTDLIDQWVQVSKIASVSVETLATGVAVLGDSAETAGLGLEELNALVAVISETSLSSGKETANIAKALIGNYQQDSAVKELNRLGIAVTDTTGKTRQFIDVMKEVAALRSQGILGDQDFSRLTLALGGGGIRRQKDVSAFIENFGRYEQIAGGQGGAQGQAADALAKKLDTVQTGATNLGNAFTNLAQSLGEQGGLLDAFSGALTVATSFVDVLEKLAGAAGKVAPLLMAVGVAALVMRGQKAQGIANAMVTNLGITPGMSGALTGQTNPLMDRLGIGRNVYGASAGGGAWGSALSRATTLPSIAAISAPAIQNFAAGDTKEAGANIAGGIAGALVGGPVGALVGSAIAEAFVRSTITYKSDFIDLFSGTVKAAKDEGGAVTTNDLETLNREVFKAIGYGSEELGKINAQIYQGRSRTAQGASPFTANVAGSFETPGAAALDKLKTVDPELYKRVLAAAASSGTDIPGVVTKQTKRQAEIRTPETLNMLGGMQAQEQDRLRTEMLSGKIKPSDYQNRLSSVSSFSVTATGWLAAMETQVGGIEGAFSDTKSAYEAFLEILSSGNSESINNINSQIATITELQNIIDSWNPEDKTVNISVNGVTGDWTKEGVQGVLENLTSGLAVSAADAAQKARLQNLPQRDVYGSNVAAAPTQDISTVISETVKLQDRKFNNLEPADYQALKDSWEPFYVLVEEAGKVFYRQVVDASGKAVDKGLFGEAYKAAQEAGTVTAPGGGGLPWSSTTATAAQLMQAQNQAVGYTAQLQAQGYQPDITEALYSTSDKNIVTAHGDQKVIQYLLQQILDTEKKQLQGVWNLPEGASFWVPLQSMIDTAGGGGYGMGTGASTGADTTATDIAKAMDMTLKEDYLKSLNMGPRGATRAGEKYEYATSTTPPMNVDRTSGDGQTPNLLEQLIGLLKSIFPQTPTGPMGSGRGGGIPSQPDGFKGGKSYTPSPLQQAQAVNTKVDIKFTSTTNLLVDGRVLATVIKPYFAADLAKANEAGGTLTRSYVV